MENGGARGLDVIVMRGHAYVRKWNRVAVLLPGASTLLSIKYVIFFPAKIVICHFFFFFFSSFEILFITPNAINRIIWFNFTALCSTTESNFRQLFGSAIFSSFFLLSIKDRSIPKVRLSRNPLLALRSI